MELKDKVIYQIFVRDYTEEGTLRGVINHLDEIDKSGADIVYLMPIYPIGKIGRKGTYGSPYSIQDYEEIDPSIGTKEDLKELADKLHKKNKKLMLDMVFNHTSRDSRISKEHPDWFYLDKDGKPYNRVADWTDVIDINHNVEAVEEYLVNVLKGYQDLGVDGFRFDVASLIKPSFFSRAKKVLGNDCLFLGEVIDAPFINYLRTRNIPAYANAEYALNGVELFYPYASYHYLRVFLQNRKEEDLLSYQTAFALEESSLPYESLVVRSIENHDKPRIASFSRDENLTRSLLAFSFFTRGPAFVYAGEEYKATHQPDLFEKEVISHEIKDKDYYDFYQKLVGLKKREKNKSLIYSEILSVEKEVLFVKNTFDGEKDEYGFFNLSEKTPEIDIPFNGKDLLSGKTVKKGTKVLSSPLWVEEE